MGTKITTITIDTEQYAYVKMKGLKVSSVLRGAIAELIRNDEIRNLAEKIRKQSILIEGLVKDRDYWREEAVKNESGKSEKERETIV